MNFIGVPAVPDGMGFQQGSPPGGEWGQPTDRSVDRSMDLGVSMDMGSGMSLDMGLCMDMGIDMSLSGGGHSNPLQYSCLENPMDRGAWWAAVHGVTQSWT